MLKFRSRMDLCFLVYSMLQNWIKNSETGVILKMAHLIMVRSSTEQRNILEIVNKNPFKSLLIPHKEIVQIIQEDERPSNEFQIKKQCGFVIDSSISQSGHLEMETVVEVWGPDDDNLEPPELESMDNLMHAEENQASNITDTNSDLRLKERVSEKRVVSHETECAPSHVTSNVCKKTGESIVVSDSASSINMHDTSISRTRHDSFLTSKSDSGYAAPASSYPRSSTSSSLHSQLSNISALNPNAKEFRLNSNGDELFPSHISFGLVSPVHSCQIVNPIVNRNLWSPVSEGSFYYQADLASPPMMPPIPVTPWDHKHMLFGCHTLFYQCHPSLWSQDDSQGWVGFNTLLGTPHNLSLPGDHKHMLFGRHTLFYHCHPSLWSRDDLQGQGWL